MPRSQEVITEDSPSRTNRLGRGFPPWLLTPPSRGLGRQVSKGLAGHGLTLPRLSRPGQIGWLNDSDRAVGGLPLAVTAESFKSYRNWLDSGVWYGRYDRGWLNFKPQVVEEEEMFMTKPRMLRSGLLLAGLFLLLGVGMAAYSVNASVERDDCPGRVVCPLTGEEVCKDQCPLIDADRSDCPGKVECPLNGELVCKDRCPLGTSDVAETSGSETPACCAVEPEVLACCAADE